MADANPYEVRCERCKTSFAVGTTRCVHCGGPIGRRVIALEALRGARGGRGAASDAGAESSAGRAVSLARLVMIALVVGIAIVRACLG